MNKLYYKNPDNLKTSIDQFIVLEGEEQLGGATAPLDPADKVGDQSFNRLKMPSKYATILTCSFEKDRVIGSKVKMLS